MAALRRDFLKVGALGMGGLALSDLLRARATASAAGRPTRNTSVVWLWLGGGPTHVETFDPKMSAPMEFRSTVGAVQTNVPGIELGGVFPQLGAWPTRWLLSGPSRTTIPDTAAALTG